MVTRWPSQGEGDELFAALGLQGQAGPFSSNPTLMVSLQELVKGGVDTGHFHDFI